MQCGWQFAYFKESCPVVVCNKDEKQMVTSSDEMAIECIHTLTFIFIYCIVYMNKRRTIYH